ncbi:MAG: lipopolysaccharide transport periplasmic protein LptA [Gallionellaceae bacterium]|nr:lipopolysaccharide transport periplasmic protein LptA [Gallionellaceae bacterium]MDD5364395.1 lipopolysaccharide transport periplasmic protein LptA [Gallionellaceae bacterium]
MKTIVRTVLLLGMTCLAPSAALAEKADRSRPIQIEADSVRMDDAQKTAVYEGNVIFTQGTLTMNADRIEVHQDDAGMSAGQATGQPVYFRQKVEGRDEFLEARARRIDYDARTETMKLIGNAFIGRGSDELRGGVIVYDVRSERYQADGASEDNKQGRVRAMIRPRSQPDAEGAQAKP